MKRAIVTGILIFICFLLQSVVCPWFAFAGVMCNLLIILTASFGFMCGESVGLLTGFFCGLLVDIFSVFGGSVTGDIIGYYALLYMLIGYMNGRCHRMFYPEDIKLPLLMITSSDIALNLVTYLILFLLRAKLDVGYYLLHIILPEAVYTVIVAFVFYPLFLFINQKLNQSERGSTDSIVEKD